MAKNSTKAAIASYPFIWAWGKMLGSYPYYIEGEMERAAKAKAPRSAIYEQHGTDVWATFDGITSADTKARIKASAIEAYRNAGDASEAEASDAIEQLLTSDRRQKA